jgi:hypothetical protein
VIIFCLIGYYLSLLDLDNYLFYLLVLTLVAIGYGIYDKAKRKRLLLTTPSPPLQQTQIENIKFCSKCGRDSAPDSSYCLNCGKNFEDKFSLEKRNKQARKIFLSFSLPLFPGLMALVGFNLFYSNIYSYLAWYFGDLIQYMDFVNSFLILFVIIFGSVFTLNLWKYISAKRKLKQFQSN